MATKRWKCLECGKDFGVGEWACADGVSNHVVEPKMYRSLDAPSDPSTKDQEMKHAQTVVCNIPPPTKVMEGDDVRWIGEGSVVFIRGMFSTSDPIQQYWLDKRPAYNASQAEWNNAWLTQNQKLEIRDMELKAGEQKLINDRNELLSKVQQNKREPVAAH